MKAHLKAILLLVFGLGSLASILSLATPPKADDSVNNSMVSTSVAQTATEPLSGQETLIAQASRENALAAELQGRPTIVKIYADWCPACQRLRPVTNELQQQFDGKANFVIFDVTNRETTQAAEARARELGLSNFLASHRAQTSTVAIINPGNGQTLTQFRYNFNQQDYVNGINRAIERVGN
ncbi:MAG: thioredoxin family protein [Leptolyngbyaceae cyanobacterium RM2_2_4]|nr:thioredoxin family protein [Leptolyngbyaceae cyanobacterium SM1_4_3]NJN89355.1 thioredoxin family protein [Leptolyngbyaceae cyanobacterium SL_5_14]NJO49374.1 thioredoxin family protein [Leptolyngbyaceae cyanobacterium RM2_2_4]